MNNTSKSKQNDVFEDDEIFADSSFLANFENTSFKETNKTTRLSESNINDSLNRSGLNVSALCCDEEISGYDKLTGKTWIYPTNYPVRDYQFNIIKASILKNTLVSLPTGLGKTFIAAVIMYNFYRWYPLGKIVFTAPTRPLVAQQIEACYDIIAIPPDDTIEMTGHMQVNTRKTHWQTKRVFFATPQVIYNDIKSGICPSDKIRCLVIDEAHRARGNYAYCQIVGSLDDMGHKTYRLLALSATPGSKVEDVINVVKSLHIAHLELRTENCIDVAPYSHTRKINTVIIKLGSELTQLRQHYVEILDGYARRLKQLNILPHNLGNLSKGRIVMLYKEFQNKERGARHPQHNYIMKDFTLLIALFHGLELLVKHGTRVFLNFFDEHPEKSWIQSDDKLTALLERLRDDLGINPLSLDRSILPDGTIPEMPKDLCFGHPKFDRLKDIMTDHFVQAKRKGEDTRAIVFCEYRESVNLVHCLLLQCRPLITPQMFVGQGASGKDGKTVVSQKQQLRVMRSFREGMCNVLVATCVAEEGLDVGSVDLIVCFDISTRSPIRLVQRCGRTGRERGGQVHILVTEGREHQTLLDCMRQKDGLNKKILQSKDVENNLYKLNPRMVPHDFTPQCQKMYITVAKKTDPKEKKKEGIDKSKKLQGQKDLRTMLLGRASSGSSGSLSKEIENHNFITEDELKDIFPDGMPSRATFVGSREYWAMSREKSKKINATEEHGQLNLSTWLEWQRSLQKTVNIAHSKDSEILTELLHYSDAKRFDMPASTQNPVFNSQDLATQNIVATVTSPAKPKQPKKRLKQPILAKSPAKKDGDIRALFSTATKSTKSYTKLINDLGVPNDGSIPTSLINLLVDLSLDNTHTVKNCYICLNVCDCSLIQNLRTNKKQPPLPLLMIGEPKLPDIDLIDEIDADSILKCMKNNSFDHSPKKSSKTNVETINCSTNFDLEFDFDIQDDFSTPKDEIQEEEKFNESIDKNFDIGDIEDIFADSNPEEAIEKEVVELKDDNPKEAKETLGFFGLDSIDDIFADYDESIETEAPCIPELEENNDKVQVNKDDMPKTTVQSLSPSILSGKVRNIATSPILCTQVRKFQLSTKKVRPQSSTPNNAKKSLFQENKINNDIIIIPDEKDEEIKCKIGNQNTITNRNSIVDTTNKSMFTITQLVEMINKTDNSQSILKPNITKEINAQEDDERSTSPILLTQAERKSSVNRSKIMIAPPKKSTSLIILDSDSDSNDNTQEYDVEEATKVDLNESISKNVGTVNSKRKYETDETISASPFFNKRPKLDSESKKPLTIQEKVLAALSTNKNNNSFSNNNTTLNFTVSQPNFMSQKENKNPKILNKSFEKEKDDENKSIGSNNLDMLKIFRRDSKINIVRKNFDSILNKSPESSKRKIDLNESDDDFVVDEKNSNRSKKPVHNYHESKSTTNHKVRKKKKKANSFLDLEADLSGSEGQHSGDELSDDSIGSIVDFICDDDNETQHEDIHAHYVRSIKSPMKNGGFKIPVLPNKYIREDVLSQFVEEDAYEMDSFCVDSHIGLTQANDVSELELAEIVLEEERRKKRRRKDTSPPQENGESPLIRRKNKINKRLIHSDSDDSS